MAAPPYDALSRMALAFALEVETWPVFLAWVADTGNAMTKAWAATEPSPREFQRQWMLRSPDPTVQSYAILEEDEDML